MKKILIMSYFFGMLLLTFLTTKAVALYSSDNVEVKYREFNNELSDTEIDSKHIMKEHNYRYFERIQTKETRTKKLFGWETKIDTIDIKLYEKSN